MLNAERIVRRVRDLVAVAAALSVLAACGGGGASDPARDTVILPGGGISNPGGGTGSGTTTSSASIAVGVVEQSGGLSTSTLSSTKLTSLRAQVLDASGQAVAGAVVRFSASDASVVTFTPAASALTDAQGVASVGVAPASFASAGAVTLSASAQVGSATLTGSANVSIGASQVTLGALQFGQSALSAYGTTVVSVQVQGVPTTTQVPVRFTSACASQNPARATITALVTSSNGVARATYVDRGCAGTDVVTATVDGTSSASTGNVAVAAPAIANVQFVSATPQTISTRGTGGAGLSELSVVKFRVVDQANNPYPVPTNVTLALSNSTGGLLIDQTTGPVTRQTDASGEVSVQVQSGTLPTPVWVIATIQVGAAQFTSNSNVLSVTTGQPIQSKYSVSIDHPNIEGWYYDGVPASILTIAADIFGTPVPDQTVVNFLGDLVPASCQTVRGTCSVTFLSQGTRPASGRLPIVSYAVGEESFDDANGNFRYDAGERFYELGDLYLDRNENRQRDPSEGVIPFASQSLACASPDPAFPNLVTRDGGLGACDGVRGRSFVRGQVIVVLSGSFGFFKQSPLPGAATIPASYSLGPSCSVSIPFWLQDLNGNPMPYTTTISVDTGAARKLTAVVDNDRVQNTISIGGTFHTVRVSGFDDTGACVGSGTVVIKTTTGQGNITPFAVSIGP
ncbi:MAG: hypothetical protein U1E86_09515 [Burkholderiaceae bacterium]